MLKVKPKKITKRKLPVIQSSYQRKNKIPGIVMGFPGPVRTGDTIHYINKEGKLIHDTKIRTNTELKKLIMSQTEFEKRYLHSSVLPKIKVTGKSKKKNPSLENEIHDIERMKRMLSSWNLKYDVFPDIKEYVNKHWTQTYGKQEALELLNAAMNQRADLYHNVERLIPPGGTRAGKRLTKAESNWRKVVNRLNGIEEKEDTRELVKPLSKYPGYSQEKELEKLYSRDWDL